VAGSSGCCNKPYVSIKDLETPDQLSDWHFSRILQNGINKSLKNKPN
jgi:hypothetical protein